MRVFQFSKPKTPGFGISRSYYLTVLSSSPVLPPPIQLVEPSGAFGAVEGFGVPLASDAGKESLSRPMERGIYAAATKDRKTVLKIRVLSKEEGMFDSEAFAMSSLARGASPDLIARIRATWILAQFSFESHDPMVYSSLDFLLDLVQRLALLTEGVIADPIARRYRLPNELLQPVRLDPRIDARDHVDIVLRSKPDGIYAHSLGMQKFGLPELEISGLLEQDKEPAIRLMLAICQNALLGDLAKSGDRFGADKAPFEAREGGFDRTLWDGIPVLELLPPTTKTAHDALALWEIELAKQQI